MSVLLAVSGGIDSMYLAHRAAEFFPKEDYALAHCNFQLRGEESDGDEEFVRAWCDKQGIKGYFTKFNTAQYAENKGISIEMAARDLRYGWFSQLCKEQGYRAVAVAHNANDNAETLILNLSRGTGMKGLRGMAVCSERENGLVILRPMLGISRDEIATWMNARQLSWREDSSNSSCEYKRNILRHQVLPTLAKLNPSIIHTLNANMERFSQADDLAQDYIRESISKIQDKDGQIIVDKLLELKHWEIVLWHIVEHCSLIAPTFEKLKELLKRFRNEPRGTVTIGGKRFESSSHIIYIKSGRLLITKRTLSHKEF